MLEFVFSWSLLLFPSSELQEGLFLPSAAAAVGSGGSDTYVNTKHVCKEGKSAGAGSGATDNTSPFGIL